MVILRVFFTVVMRSRMAADQGKNRLQRVSYDVFEKGSKFYQQRSHPILPAAVLIAAIKRAQLMPIGPALAFRLWYWPRFLPSTPFQ